MIGPPLRWVVRNRAWTPTYLRYYWRFAMLRLRHPHVATEGFVFLGRRVELYARKDYGRLILGRWVHIGDDTKLRAHEGTLRIGDKVVFGRDNAVNCYLDIEIGGSTLVADWVYMCDFDHKTDRLEIPIKDQGIVKSPVRIGPDCWIGVKASVLRGTTVGRGSVLAAHTVARGDIPEFSVVAGLPGRVVKNRLANAEDAEKLRTYLAQVDARQQAAVKGEPLPPVDGDRCQAQRMEHTLSFGYDGDGGLGDRLLAAVLRGEKTATSSLAVEYSSGEALPRVGERLTLVDHAGGAHGIVETTRVTVTPLDLVGDDVARDEGEGFSDAGEWRRAHVSFWAEVADLVRTDAGDPDWELRETEPVVVHWFRVVGSRA